MKKLKKIFINIKNFFFPKDFMGQIRLGMQIGSKVRNSDKSLTDKVYQAGKKLRENIDPKKIK